MRIVSYNIHSGIGTDGRFDLGRIAQVLREIAPDIAALQEVGDYRGRTERDDHPEVLARELGLQLAFGANVVRGGRRYGNAILSRYPVRRSRNYDLSVRGREPRGALRCDLDADGTLVHVFCLHLGLGLLERRTQSSLLLSADILKDAARANPVVVCGDFNAWWAIPALVRRSLFDSGRLLGAPCRTWPSRRPFLRLDRIYVDRGLEPELLAVHRTEASARASDHLPLVLSARLLPAGISPNPAEVIASGLPPAEPVRTLPAP